MGFVITDSKKSDGSPESTFVNGDLGVDMSRTATIILSGGQGTRLFPLTLHCSKPAVRIGGKFKLIDIPISNAINSGCGKIFVLTQFFSSSLHSHIFRVHSQRMQNHSGCVELLTAEQKHKKQEWFQGTADAVRQNLDYLYQVPADYFLILSGDQLYSMDYKDMMRKAIESNADVVIAALPIEEKECHRMGLLKIDAERKVVDFVEKPNHVDLLKQMKLSATDKSKMPILSQSRNYLASMGIYLFKRDVLFDLLQKDPREDFGKHLLPSIVEKGNVYASIFDGYWEDIGTIDAFYRANMDLIKPNTPFNFYNEKRPVYGAHFQLPPAQIIGANIASSFICDGCVVEGDEIQRSILGPRTIVGKGTKIFDSYVMGSAFYKPPIHTHTLPLEIKIGRDCLIKKAIIDKNVCIGNNVRLTNANNVQHYDGECLYVRDGIIVIPRGVTIPDGFTF